MDRNDAEHSGDSCCNKNKQTNRKTLVTYSEQDMSTHQQKIFAKKILSLGLWTRAQLLLGWPTVYKSRPEFKAASNNSKPSKIF